MKCPLCIDEVLDVTFRSGIEVDVCPRCRGVWLDRGELDRLVDEPAGELRAPAPAGQPLDEHLDDHTGDAAEPTPTPPSGLDAKRSKPMRPQKPRKKKKRKKKDLDDRIEDLFEELFDFFD